MHCTARGLPHRTQGQSCSIQHVGGCNVLTRILSRDPVNCELLQNFEISPEEAENVE